MQEIERKFLIRKLPELSEIQPIAYERRFLSNNSDKQIRIQRKNDKYELETKTKINELEYRKTKKEISEKEFLELSAKCSKTIIRDSYLISVAPEISVKIYHGDYEGLIRAEIEYKNLAEIKTLKLPIWFGREITGIKLASDAELIKLSRDEFWELLNDLSCGKVK